MTVTFDKTADFCIEKYIMKEPMPAMHYHQSYELYYLMNGSRDYFIGDKFFKVDEGDFVFVPKNILHRTGGKTANRILVYFTDSFLGKYFTETMISYIMSGFEIKVVHPDENTAERLMYIYSQLLSSGEKNGGSGYGEREAGLLFELLFMLAPLKSKSEIKKNGSLTEKMVLYINEHFASDITMNEVAEHFYVSESYLCRTFKKELGITFSAYLNSVRVREACRLLEKHNVKIMDVAEKCGFDTSSYFCKVFQKETGVTPREYQKYFSSGNANKKIKMPEI